MDADLFVDDDGSAAPARWRSRLAAWQPRQWLGTMKVRLVVGVLAALLAGMAWTAWSMGEVAEAQLLQQAQAREQREAQRTAAVIGRRLADLQRALAVAAQHFDPALVHDRQRLEGFVAANPVLRTLFHYVNVADPEGHLLISVDDAGVRRPQVSIADRPHFQRAVREQRAQISAPLPGRVADEPIVAFAHPVVADGQVRAVLLGVLRLASRDLLADLAEARDDDHGTIVVVTDDAGTVVAHPQRAMLLHTLADEPRLAQAYVQWEAQGRPLQRDAGHWRQDGEVVAMGGEGEAGWHVWRASPRDVLLAPLAEAQQQAMRQAALAAVALAAVLGSFVAWQLRPLRQLEVRAQRVLHGGDGAADDDWPDADGEIGRLARTLRHVWAERTQMESFNAEVLGKLRSVMAAAPVGLAFTRHGRFELVSAEFCRLVGREEPQMVGQPTRTIFAAHDDDRALGPRVAAAFERGEPYVGEWRLLSAERGVFWARLRARPVDEDDPAAGTIWSCNDISEQVRSRQQLEHDALHDALTGVANRKGFEQAVAQVLASPATARPASIVMIDLDHFKPINDTAGHAAGDAMLVAVARAIAAAVRTSDTVARLGGDEFALLLTRCDHAQALAVAEKVRRAIADVALPWHGRQLRVGASLGVAELGAEARSAAQWLSDADDACYAAKRSGRGTVRSGAPALRLVAGDAS